MGYEERSGVLRAGVAPWVIGRRGAVSQRHVIKTERV